MQVWYRTVSLVTSSESKQKIRGKNFRGWRLTTKLMKLNQPRKFLRIRYLSSCRAILYFLSSYIYS